MSHLRGKKVIVTGGSRGFGRGIVQALAAEGATVHALARTAADLDQLQRDMKGVQTCVADVTDPDLAAQILREVCPNVLVLNAGAQPSCYRSMSNPGTSFAAIGKPMSGRPSIIAKRRSVCPKRPSARLSSSPVALPLLAMHSLWGAMAAPNECNGSWLILFRTKR